MGKEPAKAISMDRKYCRAMISPLAAISAVVAEAAGPDTIMEVINCMFMKMAHTHRMQISRPAMISRPVVEP